MGAEKSDNAKSLATKKPAVSAKAPDMEKAGEPSIPPKLPPLFRKIDWVTFGVTAVLVFILFALVVPRPIFWYRIVGVVALVLSWLPDIGLGLGGTPMRLALRYVSPLTQVGFLGERGGPPPGGPPPGAGPGGPPGGILPAAPIEQVLVLMLLHTAVAVVCIVMLTTLTRERVTRP